MDTQQEEARKACSGDCHERLLKLKDSYDRQKKDLQQAAVIGKSLLEENSQLKEDFKKLRQKVELLVQEKHELEMKQELLVKSESCVSQENETLRETVQQLENSIESLQNNEKEKNRREATLISQIDQLKAELASERENFASKYTEMENALTSMSSNRREARFELDCGHETDIANLQSQLEAALEAKSSAEKDLNEARQKVAALQNVELKLRGQISELETQLDQAERQVTAVNNLLEEKRMENLELQGQLEAERISCVDPEKRGNSLFGEIEDRRQQAERQLEKLKILYDTLVKKNQSLQAQNVNLKNEVTLLSFGSGGRDRSDHVTQLNKLISEQNTQNERLLQTVALLQEQLREKEKPLPSMSAIQGLWVKELLEEHKVEVKKLDERLQDEIRGRICFTERTHDVLKRLDDTEGQLRQARGEIARQKMQIETLMRKKDNCNQEENLPTLHNPASKQKVEKLPDSVKVSTEAAKENITSALADDSRTNPAVGKLGTLTKDEPSARRKVRMNPEIQVVVEGGSNEVAELNTEEKGTKFKATKKPTARKVEMIKVPPPDPGQPECKTQ